MYFLNILRRFCDFCEHPSLLFLISLRIQEDFDTWYQKHCFPLPWIIRKYLFVLYSWWNFVLCFQSHGCLAFEFAAKFKLKRGLIWNFDTAHTLEGGGKDRIEKVGVEVLGWGEIVLLANWKAGRRRNDHGHQHLHHRHAGLQQRRRSSIIAEEEEEDNAKETDDDYDEKKELLDG